MIWSLTLLGPMELSIKLYTIKSGWSMVYIEGSQFTISENNIVFLFLIIDLVLSNNGYHDEMPHHAVFHLGLHCLPKSDQYSV